MNLVAGADTRRALLTTGDRPALLDPSGRSRTGAELVERVDALAGGLVGPALGGRVGLWYRNSIEAVEAFLAVEWLGATRVPVDPGAAPDEAVATFAAAGVDVVLTDSAHAGLVPDSLVHDRGSPLRGTPCWPAHEVPAGRPLVLYSRMVRDGELLAVPISYGNWAEIMRVNVALYRDGHYGPPIAGDDVYLTVQQLMHGTGLLGTFPFLLLGLPQVIVEKFAADALPDIIGRFGVTSTMLVSAMLPPLRAAYGGVPTPLRRVVYGGAPLPADDLLGAVRAFGPVLVQVYGRLEGGWPISLLSTADHAAISAGDRDLRTSCGRPIDAVRVRVRDGELSVRTPMASAEYTNPDGWCALGDLARLDERGYLHHLGRVDGMINNGYHVYPAEVEHALRRLPGVADARVVGEPDPRRGQAVVAYVVSTGDAGTPAQIRDALRQRLAAYKVPERVEVVAALP